MAGVPAAPGGLVCRGASTPGRPPVAQVGTPKRPPCGETRCTAGTPAYGRLGRPHLRHRPGWRYARAAYLPVAVTSLLSVAATDLGHEMLELAPRRTTS